MGLPVFYLIWYNIEVASVCLSATLCNDVLVTAITLPYVYVHVYKLSVSCVVQFSEEGVCEETKTLGVSLTLAQTILKFRAALFQSLSPCTCTDVDVHVHTCT